MEWKGFHFYDMIFPLFLFIIGVSLPFAWGAAWKRAIRGPSSGSVKRTIILLFLGWLYTGLLDFKGMDHQRMMGVLQRLALGYCFAAFIMLFTKTRGQIAMAAGRSARGLLAG